MEVYQIGFLEFLIFEIFETKELIPLAASLTKFWIHTIKNDDKRRELIEKTKSLIKQNMNFNEEKP